MGSTSTTTTDRRRHERTEIALEGTITRVAGRPLTGPSATIDLSEGGARLLGPTGFTVGDVVKVSITRGDTNVERQGLVVRCEPTTAERATLHVAFRTTAGSDTVDLRELISPLD